MKKKTLVKSSIAKDVSRKKTSTSETAEISHSNTECSVCCCPYSTTGDHRIVITKCGHICLCGTCGEKLDKCPLCRKVTNRSYPLLMKIYVVGPAMIDFDFKMEISILASTKVCDFIENVEIASKVKCGPIYLRFMDKILNSHMVCSIMSVGLCHLSMVEIIPGKELLTN